jgi:hypothetical protein
METSRSVLAVVCVLRRACCLAAPGESTEREWGAPDDRVIGRHPMDGKAAAARLGGPVRLADARTGGASCDYRNTRAWMMPIPPFTPHRGHDMTDQWPLQSFLELGSLPSAVPCARLHVRQLLWEWQYWP